MTTQESSTTEGLSFTDDLPADPLDIESWARKVSEGDTGTNTVEAEAAAKAAADAAAKAQAEAEAKAAEQRSTDGATPGAEGEVHGVLAKDGKHVLPFSAIEAERKRAREAKDAAEAANARLAALEKELEELKSGKTATSTTQDTDDLIADIESQLEGVPEVAAPMKAVVERMRAMGEQIEKMRAQAEQKGQQEAKHSENEVLNAVQAAIDTTPALLFWQNEDPEMFDRAVEFDARFKADPKLQGLSLEQRFEKVVTAMEAVYGAANVPAKYLPPSSREKQTEQPKEQTATKPGAQQQERPMTLSDLPGGLPPEKNDKRFEAMTLGESERYIDQLVSKGMSPQDLASHLAAGYALG